MTACFKIGPVNTVELALTPEQKALITSSFSKLLADREGAAALFYGHLFESNPEITPLFLGDMQQQGRKFVEMMRAITNCLDRLDQIVPLLWQMGKRHGGYGVQPSHYPAVGAALLWTLEQQLGESFTPSVRAAWVELYALISATM